MKKTLIAHPIMQVEKLVTRSSADLETKTMDSEMNMHADSETKIRKLKPQIRKRRFGN